MKRCSTLLIIGGNASQNYNDTTSHWSEWLSKNLQTIKAGEDVEKREHSYTVGGNVNWYGRYGEQYGESLSKLGSKQPYDPAIPSLGIYPEKGKNSNSNRYMQCSLQHYSQ